MIIENNRSEKQIEITRVPKKDSGRSLFYRREMVVDFDLGFLGGPQKRSGLKLTIWMWLASTIDVLVIAATTCFLMFCYSLLLKFGLMKALSFTMTYDNKFITLMVFFIFSGWMYFIASRALAAASIGERTCSLRLGQPSDRLKNSYLSRVIVRTTLTLLTGIVVLPLLSLILKKDIAGRLTGLNIYSLK